MLCQQSTSMLMSQAVTRKLATYLFLPSKEAWIATCVFMTSTSTFFAGFPRLFFYLMSRWTSIVLTIVALLVVILCLFTSDNNTSEQRILFPMIFVLLNIYHHSKAVLKILLFSSCRTSCHTLCVSYSVYNWVYKFLFKNKERLYRCTPLR